MFRNIITTAFLVFAYITCNAQSSDGTMLLDDATSQTRVVTNAFLNASNAVHELIQSVSPKADFSTNNAELVVTISATVTNSASGYSDWVITPPSLEGTPISIESDGSEGSYWMLVWRGSQYAQGYSYSTNLTYQLEGVEINAVRDVINTNVLGLAYLSDIKPPLTTNDVCAIVTNATVTPTGDWVLDESRTYWESGITISEPLAWNGSNWVIEFYDGDMYRTVAASGGFDALELNFYVEGPIATADIWYTRPGAIRNALGLAMASDLTNYVATVDVPDITNGLASATITNGLIGADYIATNNDAFVTAVTNCPVVIASADSEALTEWGVYGGGGTIGALLAALAAAVAALKKKKMPLYPVGGTGNPVNATYESGVLTISPFAMAAYTPAANAAFSVTMGALPSDMEAGNARDAVLVIDCTSLAEGEEPTVTWGSHFHPRTDAGTDFACEVGVRNVYYISEYAPGEFAVGGWQETTGGSAT